MRKTSLNNFRKSQQINLMCCTDKEYQKNLEEYTRQEIENRFGYDESY